MGALVRRVLRPPGSALVCVIAAIAATAVPASAQQITRTEVAVDYVGVEGIYLVVGTEQGVQAGDTLVLFPSESATTPLGSVRLTAATRRRSVGVSLGTFSISAGDVVYVELPEQVEVAEDQPTVTAGPSTPQSAPAARDASGPRMTGRLALSVDARETRTSWEGNLFGTTRRRFATPTSNLSLTVSELPGGLRVETNLRASYRYSDLAPIQPTTSVRVYSLSAIKTFERVPFEVRLGRFYNPYEGYSSYWDGALLRLGRRTGPGVGVVAGFEPNRSNEGFSTDLPKVTAFADFSHRGRGWSYDTDASLHFISPEIATAQDRRFVGWSQRLSLGRLRIDQRLRMEQEPGGGSWSLAQLRLRTGLRIAGPLRLDASYGKIRPGVLLGIAPTASVEREEVTGGFGLSGAAGTLSADVGTSRWDAGDRSLVVSAAATARMGQWILYASGRRWSRDAVESLSVAPGLGMQAGRWGTRLGYQLYQTDSGTLLRSHSADLSVDLRLTETTSVTVQGQQQWGANFGGTRIRLRIWRRF